MKRVAICLSGQYRSFGTVEEIYKIIPEAYPNIKFDIFLAGWDYEKECYSDSKVFTQKKFFKDILPHKGGDLQLRITSRIFYLQKQVSILREEYEKKHGFLYDAVISTRPDIILYPQYFKKVEELVNLPMGAKVRISNLMIFTKAGMQVTSDGMSIHDDIPFLYEIGVLGSSISMSKYMRTYDNYVDENGIAIYNAHTAPVYQCFNNNIAVVQMDRLFAHIVREEGWVHKVPAGVYREEDLRKSLSEVNLVDAYRNGHAGFLKEYLK